MTSAWSPTFTARDAITAGIGGHGVRPVADPTGTTATPTRAKYDPALFDAYTAGVRRAVQANRNECPDCGRTFADGSAVQHHRGKTHRPPA